MTTVSVAVPHSGQTLHKLDWQSLREPNLQNAVSFQYDRLGAERLLTPKHHSVSQQTVCLVPSLGYPTLVNERARSTALEPTSYY
jgi:hypothetical protein